jgi:hypothetical protein
MPPVSTIPPPISWVSRLTSHGKVTTMILLVHAVREFAK